MGINMPNNFVPTLARQTMQTMDNTVREARGGNDLERAFNQIATQMPILSAKYPAKYDTLGQAVQRYNYGNNSIINTFFNPAHISKFQSIPEIEELTHLYQKEGTKAGVPENYSRTITLGNGQQMQLDNQQIATLQRYVGQVYGTIVTHDLASPVYAKLPDQMKQMVLAKDLATVVKVAKADLFGGEAKPPPSFLPVPADVQQKM